MISHHSQTKLRPSCEIMAVFPYNKISVRYSILITKSVTKLIQSIVPISHNLPSIFIPYLGSHIYLAKRPQHEPDLYYNRKQDFSVNIMIVCNNHLRIVHYYLGAFGSAHDKRVFRCSELPEILSNSEPGLFILGTCVFLKLSLLSKAIKYQRQLSFR